MNKLCFVCICLYACINLYAQERITETNYLKADSILWTNFEKKNEELSKLWEIMSDKRDSIQNVFHENLKEASRENIELAIKYASVPSGLKRLYMTRLDIPKDTLENILNSLHAICRNRFMVKISGNICKPNKFKKRILFINFLVSRQMEKSLTGA